MMADDQALQGPPPHLANGSRGRSQVLPYQPHGFTVPKCCAFSLLIFCLFKLQVEAKKRKN